MVLWPTVLVPELSFYDVWVGCYVFLGEGFFCSKDLNMYYVALVLMYLSAIFGSICFHLSDELIPQSFPPGVP